MLEGGFVSHFRSLISCDPPYNLSLGTTQNNSPPFCLLILLRGNTAYGMSGGNPNGAAMALWQKFSDLQAQAEKHRSDRVTTEANCGRLRNEIEQIKQERNEDEKKIRLLEEGAQKFQNILDPDNQHGVDCLVDFEQLHFEESGASSSSIHEKLELAKKHFRVQTDRLNAAEQSWEQWNHWKQEQLISASDRSRSWRDEMQRLQLEAISVGLPHAYLEAAHFWSGLHNPISGTTERDLQGDEAPDDRNENDPLSWKVQENDLVLRQALDAYKIQNDKYLAERAVMTTLEENIRAQQAKCEKKKQRASSLREQIQKVQNDRADLGSKIEKAKGPNSTTHRVVGTSTNPYLQCESC